MKIVIAQMEHETNTFSPVETPWESFGPDGPYIGVDAYRAMKGTKTPIGAFIDIAEEANADIITSVAGFAYPSGPVSGVAYDRFCELIIEDVRQGCDLIMLDLHGAMVVKDSTLDGEGTLLKKIREVAPSTPIAVSLDLHANVTADMVRNANIIVGYKTYPHIDMYETGVLAGKLLLRLHRKEINKMLASVQRKGMTIVTLKLYFNDQNRCKVLLGLAKGKKQHDKRASDKEKDWNRQKARLLKADTQ